MRRQVRCRTVWLLTLLLMVIPFSRGLTMIPLVDWKLLVCVMFFVFVCNSCRYWVVSAVAMSCRLYVFIFGVFERFHVIYFVQSRFSFAFSSNNRFFLVSVFNLGFLPHWKRTFAVGRWEYDWVFFDSASRACRTFKTPSAPPV